MLKSFTTKRLVIDALLVALFFVLSMFAVEIAGVKITFVSLPTVVCALLYGPVDACIVGLLGAFLEQMLKYGFTATTVLWLLPAVLRGLIVGLGTVVLRRSMSIEAITSTKKPYVYYIVCIVAGLVTSCANTLVFYLDSVIYHYYSFAMVFGVFWVRLATGALASFLTATVALPVVMALRKFHLADANPRRKASAQ
ncbi:putative uncharacterized protein [Firmicutes bacterium CAG:170]|nr:putative uncharacterized protein [Firmicutes bacterium CAG:170]